MAKSLIFSGHETFYCKSYWLKKGYDFIFLGGTFTDENTVIKLGVGKNMVASIRFWMKSFGLLTEDGGLTESAHRIFNDDDGFDRYLEDKATLWLLHYMLVRENYASIYSLIFGEYHRSKNEFDMPALEGFIKRKCYESDMPYNQNTAQKDIRVFVRNYVKPDNVGNIDDSYSTLLLDLGLILQYKNTYTGKDTFSFNFRNADLPPYQLMVFIILSVFQDDTIDFREIMYGKDPVGLTMCLTENAMDLILRKASENFNWFVYTEDAGIKQIQIKERPDDYWDVLNLYYQTQGNNYAI